MFSDKLSENGEIVQITIEDRNKHRPQCLGGSQPHTIALH